MPLLSRCGNHIVFLHIVHGIHWSSNSTVFLFLFLVGLREFQGVPDLPSLHNAQRHDQGHHARPRLHGGVPWGGSIARGAQINEALFHRPSEVESSLDPPGVYNSWSEMMIFDLSSWIWSLLLIVNRWYENILIFQSTF